MTTHTKRRFLIDTDVLIDFLRGQNKAVAYLENLEGILLISAITLAELYAGVCEEKERIVLEQFTRLFEVISVDNQIAEKGGIFRRDYGPRCGTGLADALIAATASLENACLITLNTKHFPMLENIIVPYKKPDS